ncbi:MBL fold metallo-hydrolase [Thermodesulfobacteriota bacterium]
MKQKRFLSIIICLVMGFVLFGCSSRFKGSGPVTIYYKSIAQFELINSRGTRVLIDVRHPEALSSPPTKKDVLLTTHYHATHYLLSFMKSFPGSQLKVKTGELKMEDAYIRSIASVHSEGFEMKPENGTNYIFIVDIGGLRIVHFGDIGQDALTPEQLEALGKVDIAFISLIFIYSEMDSINRKAFNLIEQIKPRLIIPTHVDEVIGAKIAADKWVAYNSYKKSITISQKNLPDKTTIIFMDRNANLIKLPTSNL